MISLPYISFTPSCCGGDFTLTRPSLLKPLSFFYMHTSSLCLQCTFLLVVSLAVTCHCLKSVLRLSHCSGLTSLWHHLLLHIPYNYYIHNPSNHGEHQTLSIINPAWMICALTPSLTHKDSHIRCWAVWFLTVCVCGSVKSKWVIIYSAHIKRHIGCLSCVSESMYSPV